MYFFKVGPRFILRFDKATSELKLSVMIGFGLFLISFWRWANQTVCAIL